jgi:DNA-binding beta-propeller fold protein YncE
MSGLKKFGVLAMILFGSASCAEDTSIFKNIPLTLDPILLANPIAMVASNGSKRLYVANSNNEVLWFDSSFYVLDISNPVAPTAVAVISIPNFSGNMLLDEARGYVYLPNRQSPNEADTVDQVVRININEASPGFLNVELFQSGQDPFGGYFDGVESLYVCADSEALRYNVNDLTGYTAVDLAVTTATGRLIEAEDTREVSLSPSGNNLFMTNRTDGMLIINVNQFTAPTGPGKIELGTEPVDYIVNGTISTRGATRDSQFVYVVDGVPPELRVMTDVGLAPVNGPAQEINTGSLQVASIPVGSDPGEVVVDEVNRRAYVSNTDDDTVSVIDTDLFVEITRVAVDNNLPPNFDPGDGPFPLAIANVDGTNYLYVGNFFSNNITVVDADTLTVLSSFPDIPIFEEDEDDDDDDIDFDSVTNTPGFGNSI